MDKLIKQSIDARKNAFSASYKVDAEMQRKIDGTFFEFHHHNTAEGKYWNPTIDGFTENDWREKVREIANGIMVGKRH